MTHVSLRRVWRPNFWPGEIAEGLGRNFYGKSENTQIRAAKKGLGGNQTFLYMCSTSRHWIRRTVPFCHRKSNLTTGTYTFPSG